MKREKQFDHLKVARDIAASEAVDEQDRLEAIRILQQARQWEAERVGRIDWSAIELEDIPHEHRARLLEMLANAVPTVDAQVDSREAAHADDQAVLRSAMEFGRKEAEKAEKAKKVAPSSAPDVPLAALMGGCVQMK